jgi:hypothetical protein
MLSDVPELAGLLVKRFLNNSWKKYFFSTWLSSGKYGLQDWRDELELNLIKRYKKNNKKALLTNISKSSVIVTFHNLIQAPTTTNKTTNSKKTKQNSTTRKQQ